MLEPDWVYSDSKGVAGHHATTIHHGLGDAFEVTEELLLLRVGLQVSHVFSDPCCSLGEKRGSGLCLSSPLALGTSKAHLNTPAVTEHFLMLCFGVALTQGS